MNIKVEIYCGVSKKSGEAYKALDLYFPNGYVKRIFLDNAELFMIEQLIQSSK